MPKINKNLYSKEEFRKLKSVEQAEKLDKRIKKKLTKNQKVSLKKFVTTPKTSTAFVVGNGTSRKDINIEKLKIYGTLYGCNALYRECKPDYLIAVDTKMILEINQQGYQKTNTVWTNYNRAYEKLKDFNFFKPSKGWSSGPTALWFAAQQGFKTIYILGFDYKGLDSGKKFNNMYADTKNYKRSSDGATFYGNWLRQTQQVIESHPNINFVRVIEFNTYQPVELKNYKNLSVMQKEQFCHIHNL